MTLNHEDVVVQHTDESTKLSSMHTVTLTHTPTGMTSTKSSRTAHMAKFMAWEELEKFVASYWSIKAAFDKLPKTSATNRDQSVAIDREYHWQLIDNNTPRGVKLQLINESAGVAVYGRLGTVEEFFTHWAPLPTFKD